MRVIVISLLAMFLAVSPALATPQEDFNRGNAAYEDGNYKQAVKWWRKAAEQGHAKAQFDIGLMYARGQGVIKGYKQAAKWMHQAAKQGVAEAQGYLGTMYFNGRGVIKNDQTAYMFFLLASANLENESLREQNEEVVTLVERGLTSAQIQSAQNDAAKFQAKIDARQ